MDNESSGRETQSEPEIESDDQNDPTPDDTATKNTKVIKDDKYGFKLGKVPVDFTALDGHRKLSYGPTLNGLFDSKNAKPLEHFLLFIPRKFVEDVIIPKANNSGEVKHDMSWSELTFNEFLQFFAIILYMEVIQLSERRMYWSVEAERPFVAPHLGRYMSRSRFEQILSCLPFFLDEEYHDQGSTGDEI